MAPAAEHLKSISISYFGFVKLIKSKEMEGAERKLEKLHTTIGTTEIGVKVVMPMIMKPKTTFIRQMLLRIAQLSSK
jgi:hypothetical protein